MINLQIEFADISYGEHCCKVQLAHFEKSLAKSKQTRLDENVKEIWGIYTASRRHKLFSMMPTSELSDRKQSNGPKEHTRKTHKDQSAKQKKEVYEKAF